MASTNFKLFDENKTNMMSDTEYNINVQRLNGVQAGIASSQLQNKTLYQTSLVAYSLAQIMMQNGYDANDSAAVSAFVGNMSNSLLQKVLDKATTAEAQNGVNNTKWMTPALTKAAIDILAAKSANILSSETKTLYGLGSSAVPDDAFKELGVFKRDLVNYYEWAKVEPDYFGPGSIIDYGAEWVQICTLNNSSLYIYYSDSYTIVNRKVVLTNPSSIAGKDFTSNVNWFKPSIIGKYIQLINASTYSSEGYDGVYKQAPNGDFKVEYSGNNATSYGNYLTLMSDFHTMPGNVIGYVLTSTNEAPTESGYVFKSMGRLGDKARIATGSYTGTGKYGASNPNSLTFDFEPKWVLVYNRSFAAIPFALNIDAVEDGFMWTPDVSSLRIHDSGTSYGNTTFSLLNNVLSWSSDRSAKTQVNESMQIYKYVAFG